MKKIGILTYHKSINYGSVLQTWATQQLLQQMGYNAEIIDYEPKAYRLMYHTFVPNTSWPNIKVNIKRLPIIGIINKQRELFEKFRNNNLLLSEEKYDYHKNLDLIADKYDCVVCGSDQIWNLRSEDCDPIFFLPVSHKCKKIAYAVSINDTDFTEERYKDSLRSWILDYDAISDREETGATKLKAYLEQKKDVAVTLDPTLLHLKDSFFKICSPRLIEKPYIFMYYASYDKSIAEGAKRLARKLNKPVYTALMARDGKKILELYKDGVRILLNNTAPEDFLSMIRYADYVISDSFHGTAFSIIMEKQFICINDYRVNGTLKNDERIINILEQVGLLNRYIPFEEIEEFDLHKKIDYRVVTGKRMKIAEKSIKWLSNAIEGINNEN